MLAEMPKFLKVIVIFVRIHFHMGALKLSIKAMTYMGNVSSVRLNFRIQSPKETKVFLLQAL